MHQGKPKISILNFKHGCGVSTFVWNLAHLFHLDIYTHKEAYSLYRRLLEKRKESIDMYIGYIADSNYKEEERKLYYKQEIVNVFNTSTDGTGGWIYDLGSDDTYIQKNIKVLQESDVIIVPTTQGFETTLKTQFTLDYLKEQGLSNKTILLFNMLSVQGAKTEMDYINLIIEKLREEASWLVKNENIFFARTNHYFYHKMEYGHYFLDSFFRDQEKEYPTTTPLEQLKHLRFRTIKNEREKFLSKKDTLNQIMDAIQSDNNITQSDKNNLIKPLDLKKILILIDENPNAKELEGFEKETIDKIINKIDDRIFSYMEDIVEDKALDATQEENEQFKSIFGSGATEFYINHRDKYNKFYLEYKDMLLTSTKRRHRLIIDEALNKEDKKAKEKAFKRELREAKQKDRMFDDRALYRKSKIVKDMTILAQAITDTYNKGIK